MLRLRCSKRAKGGEKLADINKKAIKASKDIDTRAKVRCVLWRNEWFVLLVNLPPCLVTHDLSFVSCSARGRKDERQRRLRARRSCQGNGRTGQR